MIIIDFLELKFLYHLRLMFDSSELKFRKIFLVLPSPLMGENSFELKIFLNFNSEESNISRRWLENSAFVLRYERIRVFRIKIPLVTIVTIGNGMMVRELYSSLKILQFLLLPSLMVRELFESLELKF